MASTFWWSQFSTMTQLLLMCYNYLYTYLFVYTHTLSYFGTKTWKYKSCEPCAHPHIDVPLLITISRPNTRASFHKTLHGSTLTQLHCVPLHTMSRRLFQHLVLTQRSGTKVDTALAQKLFLRRDFSLGLDKKTYKTYRFEPTRL